MKENTTDDEHKLERICLLEDCERNDILLREEEEDEDHWSELSYNQTILHFMS